VVSESYYDDFTRRTLGAGSTRKFKNRRTAKDRQQQGQKRPEAVLVGLRSRARVWMGAKGIGWAEGCRHDQKRRNKSPKNKTSPNTLKKKKMWAQKEEGEQKNSSFCIAQRTGKRKIGNDAGNVLTIGESWNGERQQGFIGTSESGYKGGKKGLRASQSIASLLLSNQKRDPTILP